MKNHLQTSPFIHMVLALSMIEAGFISNSYAENALTPTRGNTPEEKKGFEIAARSDRVDLGFSSSEVSLTMVLRNAAGSESKRSLRISTLEVPDENLGEKSLVLFDHPKDIAGTALLSHAKILTADDQWLYLPSLKRVKRISSSNKSGPFVGSQFAFEDFTSQELNKFNYKWLSTEPCAAFTCDVIERYPLYKNSGYTKQIAYIDQTHYQIRKVEYFDRRGALLKTLTLNNYKQYNQYWRALKLSMQNHQTKKSTDLIYSEYNFNTKLTEKDFVKNRLKRLR